MPFYRKTKQKINGKWYPTTVTVGKPVTTDEVARRLSVVSTVSPGDTFAVLKNLGGVLADLMVQGRTVKLDGMGTFYYTARTMGNGVDTEKEVSAKQIIDVRVRFLPEKHQNSNNQIITRSLVSTDMFWEEWRGNTTDSGEVEDPTLDDNGGDNPSQELPDPKE